MRIGSKNTPQALSLNLTKVSGSIGRSKGYAGSVGNAIAEVSRSAQLSLAVSNQQSAVRRVLRPILLPMTLDLISGNGFNHKSGSVLLVSTTALRMGKHCN